MPRFQDPDPNRGHIDPGDPLGQDLWPEGNREQELALRKLMQQYRDMDATLVGGLGRGDDLLRLAVQLLTAARDMAYQAGKDYERDRLSDSDDDVSPYPELDEPTKIGTGVLDGRTLTRYEQRDVEVILDAIVSDDDTQLRVQVGAGRTVSSQQAAALLENAGRTMAELITATRAIP